MVTQRSLRVLVLADSRAFHTERYVRELRAQGCQVLTASLERGSMTHFHLSPMSHVPALDYTLASCTVRAIVRRFRPDIVNPHFVSGYGFMAMLAGIGRFAPVLTTLWGSDILVVPQKSPIHRWKVTRALSYSDYVLGDSKYILDKARSLAPLKGTTVIPWGIERTHLALYRDHTLSVPLRIIVPRMHEGVYGNELILRSLAPLITQGHVVLTVPAFGSQVSRFRSLATQLVGDRIRYYQKMPRACFLKFMAQHDIYLSNASSDSSPASLIEAFALGLIPVAADIPGVREWLTQESGFLYKVGKGAELRALVETLVSRKESFSEQRRLNLAKVQREAVFEQNIASVIDIMNRLVAERRA